MGNLIRYSVVVLAVMYALAILTHRDNTAGVYEIKTPDTAIAVLLNQNGNTLSGNYNAVEMRADGTLKIENYTLQGTANGLHVNLEILNDNGVPVPITVWGDVDNNRLTLSFVPEGKLGYSLIFGRSSIDDFNHHVDYLQNRSIQMLAQKTKLQQPLDPALQAETLSPAPDKNNFAALDDTHVAPRTDLAVPLPADPISPPK